ncbi:DNA cytosine methyltransferase [Mesoterricola silvestris]|uniref:DNA (cytosine-5-)-methyltransferase n=1 Tax=Mesoterricola silvestris TaxID=2927979 RepID=A0AA48GRK2_9BACT|nr:hypothetical protein METEAL_21040 [Mesoterricola silvestris]
MNELALFAGAGGGILGGKLLGWRTVCAVEIDAYARRVLLARQRDGILEPFPIWDDVRSFRGEPWRGQVDVISGGFPCQDISIAGQGAGIDGARSGLWSEFARIIGEVGPEFVLVENSPMLVGRGLGRVLGDLADLGYAAEWGVLGADDAGAPHIRKRIWILAHAQRPERRAQGFEGRRDPGREDPDCLPSQWEETTGRAGTSGSVVAYVEGLRRGEILRDVDPSEGSREETRHAPSCSEDVAHPNSCDQHGGGGPVQVGRQPIPRQAPHDGQPGRIEWLPEPPVGRLAHGVAHRVDQLRALGNGQVPSVVALAFATLYRRLTENR